MIMRKRIKEDRFQLSEWYKGFTLVELLVAIGIFVIVALIVTGIIASLMRLNRANRQSRILLTSMNTVMDAITLSARERAPGSVFFCRLGNETAINNPIYYPLWRYTAVSSARPIVGATANLYKKLCIRCPSETSCTANNQPYESYGQSLSFLLQTKSGSTLGIEELLFYYKPGSGVNTPGGIYMSKCSPSSVANLASVAVPTSVSCSTFDKLITPTDIDIKRFYIVPIASNVDSVYSSETAAQQGVQIIIEAQTVSTPIKTIHLQTAIAARQL